MKMNRKPMSLQKKNSFMGYVFIAPLIVGVAVFFIPFMVQTFIFSFNNIEITDWGYYLTWKGISNYKYVFLGDALFNRLALSSFATLIARVPTIILFSMVVASLLNMNFKGRTFVRVMFFIPVILSCGGILSSGSFKGVSDGSAFSDSSSFQFLQINQILLSMDFNETLINVITTAAKEISNIVANSGLQIYIFLIGFQEVPDYLYEAAQVEGCSKWEQFWKITVPMVSPQIMIAVIYTLVDSYVRQDTKIYEHIYNITFYHNYGVGIAMYMSYLVVLVVILSAVWMLARKHIIYNN